MLKLQLPAVLTRPMRFPFEPTRDVGYAGPRGANETPAVNAFLDDVVQRLSPLPPETRADIRAELRAHLEASIAAREELGENRETATEAAIRQFGEPRTIARRFCRAWDTTTLETPWPAMREALRLFSLATVVYFAGDAINSFVVLPYCYRHIGNDLAGSLYFVWFSGALVVLPLLAGARVGWTFPRRGALGTFMALAMATIVTSPFYFVCLRYFEAHPTSMRHSPGIFFCFCACFFLAPGFLICLPLGTFAAFVSGSLKRFYAAKHRRTSDGSRFA